jgi:hypothetical protein
MLHFKRAMKTTLVLWIALLVFAFVGLVALITCFIAFAKHDDTTTLAVVATEEEEGAGTNFIDASTSVNLFEPLLNKQQFSTGATWDTFHDYSKTHNNGVIVRNGAQEVVFFRLIDGQLIIDPTIFILAAATLDVNLSGNTCVFTTLGSTVVVFKYIDGVWHQSDEIVETGTSFCLVTPDDSTVIMVKSSAFVVFSLTELGIMVREREISIVDGIVDADVDSVGKLTFISGGQLLSRKQPWLGPSTVVIETLVGFPQTVFSSSKLYLLVKADKVTIGNYEIEEEFIQTVKTDDLVNTVVVTDQDDHSRLWTGLALGNDIKQQDLGDSDGVVFHVSDELVLLHKESTGVITIISH